MISNLNEIIDFLVEYSPYDKQQLLKMSVNDLYYTLITYQSLYGETDEFLEGLKAKVGEYNKQILA